MRNYIEIGSPLRVRSKRHAFPHADVRRPDRVRSGHHPGDFSSTRREAFGRDPTTRRSFAPVIGNTALFLAEGADWRWQRRAVAPIFRHETLLSFVPVFAAMAQRQVERWREADRTVPTDAAAAMTRTTFEIIVEAMLGGSANLDADRYSRALTDNFDTIPWHIIYVMFSIPEWMPYPHRRRAMRSRDFLHRDIRRIVAARHFSQSSKPDLLNLMRAAHDPETGRNHERRRDRGQSSHLHHCGPRDDRRRADLGALAACQGPGQRSNACLTKSDPWRQINRSMRSSVEGLSFCRQVIQEAMRLFPPAPGIARISKAAVKIGDMQFSAGTRIHIPVFALHRNAGLWDNPDAFDPDRFAPELVKARSTFCLPALRRWTACLHRWRICDARGRRDPCDHHTRVSLRPRCWPQTETRGAGHLASRRRNAVTHYGAVTSRRFRHTALRGCEPVRLFGSLLELCLQLPYSAAARVLNRSGVTMSYFRTAILLAGLTALFMLVGYLIGGPSGAVIAFFVAAATNFITYWNADKLVLSTQGAQEVDERTAPELVHMVAELAQRAELPMPRVFVMDNPQPNAFATGRNPQHGAVAVTTGLLGMLSRDELAGSSRTNLRTSKITTRC